MNFDIALAIFDKVAKIAGTTTESYYRPKLDNNLHVLDFSYEALKASAKDLTSEEYNTLLKLVSSGYSRNFNSMKYAMELLKDPHAKTSSALVLDPEYGTYIIGTSYRELQRILSGKLKAIEHSSVFTSTNEKGITETNIGHIPGKELSALRSPLSVKMIEALKATPSAARFAMLRKLAVLYNEHKADVQYQFHRKDFDLKGFNKILGNQTVLVTLQSKERNNIFATTLESKLNEELKAFCQSEEFLGLLINAPGSRSIKQNVVQQVLAILRGKILPKEQHVSKSTSKKVVTNTKIPVVPFKSSFRDLSTGKYVKSSPVNLMRLLNFHLHDVVAANMGDGNQKRILNYRTGRFATSTFVTRVSQERSGMINAFYTYMKNPYATFSEGGKQEYPKTRDPKILISKSIREIATKMGIQSLKAILV
jgi:hypothetical protein